jgi:hypothetical protein
MLNRETITTLALPCLVLLAGCGDSGDAVVDKPEGGDNDSQIVSAQPSGIAFLRVDEPNERAFSILVPQGWQSEGGIFRVNAYEAGGPLNSQKAKCDLLLRSDAVGSVMFHLVPDIVYAHVGIGGGFWQPGSTYQGAAVRQIERADQHAMAIFSYLHPQAVDIEIVEIRQLPWEIEALQRSYDYANRLLVQIGGPAMEIRADAAAAVIDYTEDGVRYRQIMATGIVDNPAAMTWENTRTLEFRALIDEFDQWRPVMDIIRHSIRFHPQWIQKESQIQRVHTDYIIKVFDEVRRIDHEILARTTINREEIMNDNFLVLTGQEEYVNPHTGEIEIDTDAFRYRWMTVGGDVYFTNGEDDDPNIFMPGSEYERSLTRRRRNE